MGVIYSDSVRDTKKEFSYLLDVEVKTDGTFDLFFGSKWFSEKDLKVKDVEAIIDGLQRAVVEIKKHMQEPIRGW